MTTRRDGRFNRATASAAAGLMRRSGASVRTGRPALHREQVAGAIVVDRVDVACRAKFTDLYLAAWTVALVDVQVPARWRAAATTRSGR